MLRVVPVSVAGFPISAFTDLNLAPDFFAGSVFSQQQRLPVSISCTRAAQTLAQCDVFSRPRNLDPVIAGVVCLSE